MKTLIFKAVLMIGIMVGISNYLMYLSTGKSPFSFDSLSFGKPSVDASASKLKNLMPAGKDQAYKWTDENGTVHYSSEPPSHHQKAELIEVNPDTNLVQGLRIETEQGSESKAPVNSAPQRQLPQGSIYNPETIKTLMDDAKGVQETLNKRYESLEKH